MEVVAATGFDDGDVLRHHFVFRPGFALDLCAAGAVVEVAVADEEDFGVLVFEAEGFDGLLDLRRRGLEVGIDEDVAQGSDDEVGREILAAYVVEVPDDLERWEGLNPGWVRVGEGVLLSRDYESRNEGHDEEQDESQALSHPTNSTKEVEWMGHPPLTQRSA